MRSAVLLGLVVFGSCGSMPPPSLADGGGVDAGSAGLTLTVSDGTSMQTVDLSTLPTRTIANRTLVGLDSVIQAAFPARVGTGFKVGFKASDGFDPASRPNCMALVPVAEARLPQGGIDPSTRNLTWEDALGYPGCLYVRDCVTLTLTP